MTLAAAIAAGSTAAAGPVAASVSGADLVLAEAVTVGSGDGPPVARVVRGIISFTHWPVEPAVIQLCIVGDARYRDRLLARVPQLPGRPVRVRQVRTADRALLRDCDVLYLAEGVAPGGVLAGKGRPAQLTISERDRDCRTGSMFCLSIRPERVSFALNLDSVARSSLRVDPKALILGRAGRTP